MNIRLSLGNIIIIGGVSGLVLFGTLAAVHALSTKDVPVLSPAARGTADLIKAVAA